CTRRTDEDRHAGRVAEDFRSDAQDRPVRHSCYRGSDSAWRRSGGDDRASRSHQRGHSNRFAPSPLAGNDQYPGIRRAVRQGVSSHPRRGHRRDGAAGCDGVRPVMKRSRTAKLLENVLPTLSIVIFVMVWELVVRWRGIAAIFLPPPSSIALYLWR